MGARNLIDYRKLKDRVSIEEICEAWEIDLATIASGTQLTGACPLCEGSGFKATPSFNSWKCFSCGEHGNILDLVAKTESVSVREASQLIAKRFSLTEECAIDRPTKVKTCAKQKKSRAAAVHKNSIKSPMVASGPLLKNTPLEWTLQSLNPEHEVVIATGLKPLTLRELRGGYCSSGLLKGRIALPFYDNDDRLIGYCGVDDTETGEERYKFPSPDKFNPALELFNLNFARAAIVAQEGESVLYVVRDPLDALHLREIGYLNTVATVVNALTSAQARSISETTAHGVKRVAFLYNNLDELSGIDIATIAISQWVAIICHREDKPIRQWSAQDIVLN